MERLVTRVIVDADVRTLAKAAAGDRERYEAIAWRDGLILAVGSAETVTRAAGAEAIVARAGGATVLPGFIDGHHHASLVALFGGTTRLVPPDVVDIPSLQRALAKTASATEAGEWVVATNWDEEHLAERRAPTRTELDDAAPDRPVVAIHYTCHRAVANSRALEAAGIDRTTPEPAGGTIGRDRRGSLTGLLVERAMSRVEQVARRSLLARDLEGYLARLGAHYRALVEVGITRIADATVPGDLIDVYREANRRGVLTIPTSVFPVSTTGYLEVPHEALDGPPTGTREGMLEIGPIKLVFDGAPGCAMCLGWGQTGGVFLRTLAMAVRRGTIAPLRASMSASPRLGEKLRTGLLLYQPEEARAIVRAALDRGFALATHAIGNEAVDVALGAYETNGPLDRVARPRLEHASFLDRDHVRRIAGVGAAVVAQPHFVTLPMFAHVPPIPGLRHMPLRWLLDAGAVVAGSSDYPVAGFDPLDGIRSAVYRRTCRGEDFEPNQRIGLDEAVALYTRSAAEAMGCLDRCGTLEPGKRADLVVLDRRLDDASLPAARVRATVAGGELVHGTITGKAEA